MYSKSGEGERESVQGGEDKKEGGYWFQSCGSQLVTSAGSNSIESKNEKPIVYTCQDKSMPYPDIVDNTEGIPAFSDILSMFPATTTLILDVGGGAFEANRLYVESKVVNSVMLVIDPFRRSRQHNQAMQKKVESVGGADVVTSMSVLNVLPTDSDCLDHIRVCWKAAKPNGLVFFKVWAGSWPMRGTGQGQIHKSKNIWQNNRWASEFKWMITKVFGKNALIFIENNLNLIVVKKAL